jgi:hypothetical protein
MYAFVSIECSTGSCFENNNGSGTCCPQCLQLLFKLRRKCTKTMQRRSTGSFLDGRRLDYMKSPGELHVNVKERQKRKRCSDMRISRLVQKQTIEIVAKLPERKLDDDLCALLDVDDMNDLFLHEGVEKAVKEKMETAFAGETTTKKEIAKYLWEECQMQARQGKLNGKKTCRFSPVMFRFCMEIYLKMGAGKYDFLASVFPIPGSRQIARKIGAAGSSLKDGVLYCNLEYASEQIPDNVPLTDISRLFWLAYDSTSISDGIEYNTHNNNIVGWAYDATEGFDAFKAVVDTMDSALVINDDDNSDEVAVSDEAVVAVRGRPELAKHYMVFIMQSASNTHKRIKQTVARYGLKKVTSGFCTRELRKIMAAMHTYKLIGAAIGCDGASENRSTLHDLATLSVRDMIFRGIFPHEWLQELPTDILDFKVAFEHPYIPNVYIWIHGDMPHMVKKVVNALECSGLENSERNLQFRGQPLSLNMCETMWRRSLRDGTGLRTSKLNEDSFKKDAANRMKCFLAFRVTSKTMVHINQEYCTEEENETYEPLNIVLLLLTG